ncbi:MFS transporter [Streptomyces sp. NPDC059063]|uniref:MFS transporter n=1 Tax=unclassified Streptomyces TaxID=2593676 RepID=UPI0036B58136
MTHNEAETHDEADEGIPRNSVRDSSGFFGDLGPNYKRLWSATVISDLGDGLRLTALPLLAASITDNPMLVAGVVVASGLPWLLLSLIGGALVDRVNRKTVMVRVQLVRAAVVGGFTVWAAFGTPPIVALYVLVFTLTSCEVLFSAASPSMLPSLVPKDRLPLANARLFGATIMAKEMIGPPLGGFLVAVAFAAPFAVDAVSYAVGAVLLVGLVGDFRPDADGSSDGVAAEAGAATRGDAQTEAATQEKESIWASAAQGLRWVWENEFVRTLVLAFGVANLSRAMTTSIFVLFAGELLDVEGWAYGVLWSTAAVGAVLCSLLISRLRAVVDDAKLVVGAMLLHGVGTTGIGLSHDPYVAGAASAAFGFAAMLSNVVGISAQQKVIPNALMGRVMSVDQLVTWGTIPLGGLLGGALAGGFGLRTPIVVGGLLMVATSLLISRPLYRAMTDLAATDAESRTS